MRPTTANPTRCSTTRTCTAGPTFGQSGHRANARTWRRWPPGPISTDTAETSGAGRPAASSSGRTGLLPRRHKVTKRIVIPSLARNLARRIGTGKAAPTRPLDPLIPGPLRLQPQRHKDTKGRNPNPRTLEPLDPSLRITLSLDPLIPRSLPPRTRPLDPLTPRTLLQRTSHVRQCSR
jgi:hypothetical protein